MENKILYCMAFFFFTLFAQIQALDYTNCGSEYSFDSVKVGTCPDDLDYCELYIGSSTSVSFNINSGDKLDQITNLINDVALYVRGTRFNVTVTPQNPCEVLVCPIGKNYNTTYAANIYINEEYQPLYADFKWVMKTNSMDDTLICFTFPVLITYYS